VIDCSMAEGAATLAAGVWSLRHNGMWGDARGQNLLDGGAPFYGCYACADGAHIALGAIEAKFFARLIVELGLAEDPLFADQLDQTKWPAMKARLAAIFAGAPRAEWTRRLHPLDCCYSEILSMEEATAHPHNRARGAYVEHQGFVQPRPAPRMLDTEPVEPTMWRADADRDALLREIGIEEVATGK
jgi:alpha-methylacyl-CoA racemase